jgi:hypothetical protein
VSLAVDRGSYLIHRVRSGLRLITNEGEREVRTLLGLVYDIAPVDAEGNVLGVEEDSEFWFKSVGKASSVFLVG